MIDYVAGDMIVCIVHNGWIDSLGRQYDGPRHKAVCAAKELRVERGHNGAPAIFVVLAEFGNRRFLAQAFRKCRKPDISVFRKLLAPLPKETVT